jgi:hypothetical protein
VAGYFGNCNELSGPIKDGNLLTSWTTVNFSRWILLSGIR